ncbi:breast carcinoma-amplified sequence 1 isoform X4 [Ascaphus truei]|uniref:breast carcinoma-amplified sequence 1 isoform X4 n=1 Tax=Ascaphus truei TaxID=8439 RepID=UPI003F5ABBCD
MGNEMSLYERADEGPNTAGSDSELATELQNGPASLQNSPPIHSMKGNDCVDAKEMVQRDQVIISSQKTIVISPIANGNEAKPPVPAAKSRFRLSVSQPSPGRTTFRAIGPEEGSEMPTEEPLMIQGQKDNKTIVGNKDQNPAPPSAPTDQPPTTSNSTGVEATPSKPKEISLFDRMFKPEKKVQVELPLEIQAEETQVPSVTVEQNAGLQSSVPRSYNPAQDIEDCKQAAAQVQKSESTSIPATPDPKETDTRSEASQTSPPTEEHPVMSFFKTLVSPNKSVPKSEEEPQTEADEKKKGNGALRKSSVKKEKTKGVLQPAAEPEGKELKKERPKTGTLSRLFRPKSKKDEQQCDNKVVEVQEVNVKPEKAAPVPILTPDTKSSEPNIQPQIPAQTAKDDAKAATEQTPRAKPFWRKSFKEETPTSKVQENSSKEEPPASKLTPNVVEVQLVTVKPEKAAPVQILTPDTKSSEPNIQPQIPAQTAKDDAKAATEQTPRAKPFWRKSFKEEPLTSKVQENSSKEEPPASKLTPNVVEVQLVNVKPEKAAPVQILTPDTKSSEPNIQPQIPAQTAKDDAKAATEQTPRAKPFWRKSFKEEPPTSKVQENSSKEEPPTSKLTPNVVEVQLVTVKPEKAAPVQILTPDTKSSEPNIQPQIPAQTAKDDAKAATEQTPRAKPFWRKSSKEEPPTSKLTPNASAEPAAQAAQADTDPKRAAPGTKAQEPQDKAKKPKEEEGKNPKPKLMSFFKQLSVIGDGGYTNSEEVNEKSTNQPTLDLSDGPEPSKTEKAVVTAVVEAPAQKSKENPKEKKPAVEPAKQKIIKQESKESPEATGSPQQQASDPVLVQNGADTAKDGQLKRTEKRQSLGSFFKAIGPKRMSDAEVQTDPVSILPAEKVK